MYDIVIDTHILVEILRQFDSGQPDSHLSESAVLSVNAVNEINAVIDGEGDSGYIVASSLTFMEVSNKFEVISENKFSQAKFFAFIKQVPEWFLIENVDENLAKELTNIPGICPTGENIENPDAIIIATCLLRGGKTKFYSKDEKLLKLNLKDIEFLA